MNHPYPINPGLHGARQASIGTLLLEAGKITPENAENVAALQQEEGIRFGEAAQRLGLVNEADIQQMLARQFDYPYVQVGEKQFSPKLVAAFQPFSRQVESLKVIRSAHGVVPRGSPPASMYTHSAWTELIVTLATMMSWAP